MVKIDKNLLNTVRALAPIVINALKRGQIFSLQCTLTEPDSDILCEYDVQIPMSDGFFVTANIYRFQQN